MDRSVAINGTETHSKEIRNTQIHTYRERKREKESEIRERYIRYI